MRLKGVGAALMVGFKVVGVRVVGCDVGTGVGFDVGTRVGT